MPSASLLGKPRRSLGATRSPHPPVRTVRTFSTVFLVYTAHHTCGLLDSCLSLEAGSLVSFRPTSQRRKSKALGTCPRSTLGVEPTFFPHPTSGPLPPDRVTSGSQPSVPPHWPRSKPVSLPQSLLSQVHSSSHCLVPAKMGLGLCHHNHCPQALLRTA